MTILGLSAVARVLDAGCPVKVEFENLLPGILEESASEYLVKVELGNSFVRSFITLRQYHRLIHFDRGESGGIIEELMADVNTVMLGT